VIKDNLMLKGFDVTLCENGADGYQAFHDKPFDLCILDVMMPIKDGITLAKPIAMKDVKADPAVLEFYKLLGLDH